MVTIFYVSLIFALCAWTSAGKDNSENVLSLSSTDAAAKQTYFQLSGFPRDAVIHSLPSSSSYFGYSVATLRDSRGRSFTAGAPKAGRRGEVHHCLYVDNGDGAPNFKCQELNFSVLNSSRSDDDKMLLGSSVSAASFNDEGFILYCGHLYKTIDDKNKLIAKGLCNLLRTKREKQPLIVNPCLGSRSCLTGFSSDLMVDEGTLIVGLGMPSNEEAMGMSSLVKVNPSFDNTTKLKYFGTLPGKGPKFYTGFAIDLYVISDLPHILQSAPMDFVRPRNPKVEIYPISWNQVSLTAYKDVQDKAEHIGGFYGFSVLAFQKEFGDIRNAFLVGEPFFSDLHSNQIDVGRVYIYCDKPPGSDTNQQVSVIQGDTPNSQFGYSAAAIGDINHDKLIDFAIGCPFCDDGHGVVYIFLSKQCGEPLSQPVEVIRGRDVSVLLRLSKPLRGFGWSISGDEDFDQNLARDLVIGTPLSDSVVLARARTRITITCAPPLRAKPCTLSEDMVLKKKCRDFDTNFRRGCSCPKYLIIICHMTFPPNVLIKEFKFNATFDLDVCKNNSKRVFNGPKGKSVFTEEKTFTWEKGKPNSFSFVLKPMVNSDRYRLDTDTPMNYSLSLRTDPKSTVKDEFGRLLPAPFLDVTSNLGSIHMKVYSCGNNLCKTDMSMSIVNITEFSPDRDPYLNREIPNTPVHVATTNIEYGVKNATVHLLVIVNRTYPDAIRAGFEVRLRNGLRFIGVSKDPQVDCNAFSSETHAICKFRLKDIAKMNAIIKVYLDMSGYYDFLEEFAANARRAGIQIPTAPPAIFEAEAKSVSMEMNPSDNSVKISYYTVYSSRISMVSGQSQQTVIDDRNTSVYIRKDARVYVDQVGPAMRHVYQLSNAGPSLARDIRVNITVPVAAENGDYLIYFFKEVRTAKQTGSRSELTTTNVFPRVISESGRSVGYCTIPSEYLNPQRITVIETHGDHVKSIIEVVSPKNATEVNATHYRVRRSADDHHEKPSGKSTSGRMLRRRPKVFVECGRDSIYLGKPKCIDVECHIDQLAVNDAVRIAMDGWLWARTIVGRSISDIEVKTSGRGFVAGTPFGVVEMSGIHFGPVNITTNFIFRRVKPPIHQQIPIWPIILGIILGILLLATIIVLLYKCGFFNRRRNLPPREPPVHYVVEVSTPTGRNEHNGQLDSAPLIPKIEEPNATHDSTDDLVEREFADMERSIQTSANEIEMRRRTKEDEEVDRLVRQVSTHDPIASERPQSFPVDSGASPDEASGAADGHTSESESNKEVDPTPPKADDISNGASGKSVDPSDSQQKPPAAEDSTYRDETR